MSILQNHRKAIARMLMRCLGNCQLAPRDLSHPLHIVLPRWDAKLDGAIVSSLFFREARKLGSRARYTSRTAKGFSPAQKKPAEAGFPLWE